MSKYLNPLGRNELEKAMLGRGVDYETIQLILRDFDARIELLYSTEDLYKQLGFRRPEILENPYGIRIYIGTKGQDDWCIEIPKELVQAKLGNYKYDKNFALYLVPEEYALETARVYTEFAKKQKHKET